MKIAALLAEVVEIIKVTMRRSVPVEIDVEGINDRGLKRAN